MRSQCGLVYACVNVFVCKRQTGKGVSREWHSVKRKRHTEHRGMEVLINVVGATLRRLCIAMRSF